MTIREAYITIWKRLSLSEVQIADALAQHEIIHPGTLDKAAPFKPGKEQEGINRMTREQKSSLSQAFEILEAESARIN